MATHAVTPTDVPALARLQNRGLILGVVGLIAAAVGFAVNRDQFFQSWLIGFLFCLGLSLGSLGLLMLQHLSGGQWGLVGRRVFEASARTMPLVALLFVPILFAMPTLFMWARPEVVAGDKILQAKAPYLNVPFFTGRAVFFFAFWIAGQLAAHQVVGGAGSWRGIDRCGRHGAFSHRQRPRTAVPRADDDVRDRPTG